MIDVTIWGLSLPFDAANAIGIISKSGRYGGTYTHEDSAFEFANGK